MKPLELDDGTLAKVIGGTVAPAPPPPSADLGQNTYDTNNNPYWVSMTAGLGTGMLLFDAEGDPVGP